MTKVQNGNDERFAHLTVAQREAVRTTDCSLLVSAAAGSGKTTVLAERCAYLVCDLPADQRCAVNDLLVVTFTDAAAGEMRSRIGKAIRQRIESQSRDEYLRAQLYLLDSASISTIHAFCKTIVQKWFPQAGIDPQASILSGDEAQLLRREALDELFGDLYGREDDFGFAFQDLVDQYGAGDDVVIGEVVLAVHEFTNSLPDPAAWLERAVRRVDPDVPGSLAGDIDRLQAERLQGELDRYVEWAEHVSRKVRQDWPQATSRAEAVDAIVAALNGWREALSQSPSEWEQVAADIRGYEFEKLKAKPRNLPEADGRAYDAAKGCLDALKGRISKQLVGKVCRFTAAEYRDGFARTVPYIRTLVDLVCELDQRYGQAKSAQASLDFNDLQRGALRLLAEGGDANCPSAIARQLQQQYRYVLVDEFQDVDPLQAAILRLVSRESADPPSGNLFTVGDIKQSIYRFRLAEPRLFADRAEAFASVNTFASVKAIGQVVHLQENFRSREGVIDAVNAVFRCLMSREFGGSAYDAKAELHKGAAYPAVADGPMFDSGPSVEVHLLEPIVERTRIGARDEGRGASEAEQEDTEGEGDMRQQADAVLVEGNKQDIEELEGIEREAYLIAGRIRAWMGQDGGQRWHVAGKPVSPDEPPAARPIEYGDIVILLRAMPHKAEPMADVLRRMGIPVRLEGANSQLTSTEFYDVHSLLQVLDNGQQDIPLAAVLRGSLLGEPLSESDLLEIRLIDTDVPFYVAVGLYVTQGRDAALRGRVKDVLDRVDRHRARVQREPLADVLWDIYEQTEYLAYVAGLPDGPRRRGHLIKLHELTRQFGHFARQGLRRFLRFLDDMLEQERGGPPVSAGEGGDNAVRIMTIHASKGLEFPVVILADLSKKFNLADTRGMALVDRELGLALQVADAQRRVRYPTLLHQITAERVSHEGLSEELRVLYVALTRAREHLVLVGRRSLVEGFGKGFPNQQEPGFPHQWPQQQQQGGPPRMELESAQCMLDWLLPAMTAMPAGMVGVAAEASDMVRVGADASDGGKTLFAVEACDSRTLFTVNTYDRRTTDGWQIPPAQRPEAVDSLARLGGLEPLSVEEPVSRSAEVDGVMASLEFMYPGLELTSLPARCSVSELKRAWSADVEADDRPVRPAMHKVARPTFIADGPADMDRAARGIVTHRFLQIVDLQRPCDTDDLRQQREALVTANRMSAADAAAVDLDDVAWFFGTDLGRDVRRREEQVQREVPFVAGVPPERVDAMVHARDHRDVLLVRGMVDLLICGSVDLTIVDYKTDDVPADRCQERAEFYRSQLEQYAEAMSAVYGLPVTRRWLVFLKGRRMIEVGKPA